jgi:hypothetical protein
MGDRANVLVKADDKDSGVYIYTHWSGEELPKLVQKALAKEWRWDDAQYLTRIIYDTVVGKEFGTETGFGISTQVGDGDDRVIEVNSDAETVKLNKKTYSFQEYVDLKNPKW